MSTAFDVDGVQLVLRARMFDRWYWRSRFWTVGATAMLFLGIVGIGATRSGQRASQILFEVAGVMLLVGGRVPLKLILRMQVTVRGQSLTVEMFMLNTLTVPLDSVAHVYEFAADRGGIMRRMVGRSLVLVAADDRVIATLSARTYREDDIAALLRLLPPVEAAPTDQSLRSMAGWSRQMATVSRRDVGVMVLGYVLVFGGVGLMVVGSLVGR